MITAAIVLLVVFLLGYSIWKADQEWQITQQCFCGHNTDALFSTRNEYLLLRFISIGLTTGAVTVGVILLAVFRPLGIVIIGFLIGTRISAFFALQPPTNAYYQFERSIVIFEIVALSIAIVIAWIVRIKNRF
jgi:hypothetical protein